MPDKRQRSRSGSPGPSSDPNYRSRTPVREANNPDPSSRPHAPSPLAPRPPPAATTTAATSATAAPFPTEVYTRSRRSATLKQEAASGPLQARLVSVAQLSRYIPHYMTAHATSPANGRPCNCGLWRVRALCGHLYEKSYPQWCGHSQTRTTGAPAFCPGQRHDHVSPLLRVNLRCRDCRNADKQDLGEARMRTEQLALLGHREDAELRDAGLGPEGDEEEAGPSRVSSKKPSRGLIGGAPPGMKKSRWFPFSLLGRWWFW